MFTLLIVLVMLEEMVSSRLRFLHPPARRSDVFVSARLRTHR